MSQLIATAIEPSFGPGVPFLLSDGIGLLNALLRPLPATDVLDDEDNDDSQMPQAIDWTIAALQAMARGKDNAC